MSDSNIKMASLISDFSSFLQEYSVFSTTKHVEI
jgi:hypothetical protein